MNTQTNAKDFAKRTTYLLGRLTVLRSMLKAEPAARLLELCGAMESGDATAAAARYHAMTAALLSTPTRRVTGDVFKDFIFSEILETPNRFSVLAAAGKKDPPVMQALAQDLRLLQELFELTSKKLAELIATLAQKPVKGPAEADRRKSEDKILNMSNAAWGGGFFQRDKLRAKTPEPEVKAELPDELALDTWVTWEYDDPGERLVYAADDGLAVVYRLFLSEKDWGRLPLALYEFHSKFGCSDFLRYRAFAATDDGLMGIELNDVPAWDDIRVQSTQKERLYANTLRFLHTGKAEHAVLYGTGGMGKSSLILALSQELPELRLVFMTQRDFSASMETLRQLSGQPFRFIAFMDDLSLSEREYRRLKAAIKAQLGASNSLIYATSPAPPPDSSVFGLELEFGTLTEDEFEACVRENLDKSGAVSDDGVVSGACARFTEAGGELSLRSARRLAESIARGLK